MAGIKKLVRLVAVSVGAASISAVGVGTAHATPTTYLPPTTHFNVLLGDMPGTITETLAVTPDGHGNLALRATHSSSTLYTYPIQVFWINFTTGQIGYVAAPYDSDALVHTGSGSVGIGNFVGFPATPSLGTVRS